MSGTSRRIAAYRTVAVAEGIAFPALLLAALVQPFISDAGAVAVLGSVHGTLFCLYLPLALLVRQPLRWNRPTTVLALLASLLPGGTWWVERHWTGRYGDQPGLTRRQDAPGSGQAEAAHRCPHVVRTAR